MLQLNTPPTEIVEDSRLRKKDYGQWEGRPLSLLFHTSTDQKCDTAKAAVPGGELSQEVMERMVDFFQVRQLYVSKLPKFVLIRRKNLRMASITGATETG